jgi:hypothetical protein
MWLHGITEGRKISLNSLTSYNHVSVILSRRIFILQSWGDHADISQAVVVYIFATGSVCSFCRLGNDLSEQVRKTDDLKLDLS